jgi:hypothetical protein
MHKAQHAPPVRYFHLFINFIPLLRLDRTLPVDAQRVADAPPSLPFHFVFNFILLPLDKTLLVGFA